MAGAPGGRSFGAASNLAQFLIFPEIEFSRIFSDTAYIDARLIDGLSQAFDSFAEPFTTSLYEVILPRIAENFQMEGNPKWAALAEATVRERGSAHPILQRTGNLFSNATSPAYWVIQPDMMFPSAASFAAAVPYGAFHQSGTFMMPQRPFMSFSGTEVNLVEIVFISWLAEKIAEMWGDYEH